MKFEYVPLLQIQRDLHDTPRGYKRFKSYLHTILNKDGDGVALAPLVAMNPMGKDHVSVLLDEYLALDADTLAAQAAHAASRHLFDEPWDIKAGLVMSDDLAGGWTNRYSCEFELRFGADRHRFQTNTPAELPRWLTHFWITGVLWTSEPASARAAQEAMSTAILRRAYTKRHGSARTLRDMMRQEGQVMASAGCAGPTLDADDLAYTREVLQPFLDADDMRTVIECLFGDEAGRTLGFTPRGLSPWAGLALALHDHGAT